VISQLGLMNQSLVVALAALLVSHSEFVAFLAVVGYVVLVSRHGHSPPQLP
jgi:hypothetical protein